MHEQGIDTTTLAVADRAPRLGDMAAAAGSGGGPDVLEAAFKKEKRRAAAEEDPHICAVGPCVSWWH